MSQQPVRSNVRRARALAPVEAAVVSFGSIGATLGLFLLLPVINEFASSDPPDTQLTAVDSIDLPQEPDVVEEEEPEPEPEPEDEPPPELEEPAEELSLAELELALAPDVGIGDAAGSGMAFDLRAALAEATGGMDELFSASDLDNPPNATRRSLPKLSPAEKKFTPGRVTVIFIVDERGKVHQPKVQKTTHPELGKAALRAVKKWRFEPGTRKGKPVQFRMRQSMTFPKQK